MEPSLSKAKSHRSKRREGRKSLMLDATQVSRNGADSRHMPGQVPSPSRSISYSISEAHRFRQVRVYDTGFSTGHLPRARTRQKNICRFSPSLLSD